MLNKSKKSVLHDKEDWLQAVIVANSYNDKFAPFGTPCLLPLVNRPLLDYTLACLSSSRVNETIVFCTSDTEDIRQFLKSKQWGKMTVTLVVSDGCGSFGDALRDLDAKAVIRSDFILLSGDLVGNLKILPALEKHRKLQKTDKGIAMTMIHKECGIKTRSNEDQVFMGINKNTDRILYHQRNDSKKLELKVEMLLDHSEVEMRYDLLDTKVSICSVSVPPLFTENFDFQTREDFIKGLLINEEILGCTLYSYVLPPTEYAASVTSWQSYHCVSHDIIHRWTYPFVPDKNIDDCYNLKKNNVYLQDEITFGKKSDLKEDTVVGQKTEIKDNVNIQSTVIGKNCSIGANSTITNSHLFSNVLVKDGAKIDFSVLGNGCVINAGATVKSCILGAGVVVAKGSVLENVRQVLNDKNITENFENDESDDENESPREWHGLRLESNNDSGIESSDSEDDVSERLSPLPDDTNLFYSEVVDSLLRGFEDKVACDNLVLEINSSRYAYNVTVNEVNYHVVKAILILNDDCAWDALLPKIKYFFPLFLNYMRNESAMNDCLHAIEDVAELNKDLRKSAMKLIHLLYEKDILSEDSILKWYQSPKSEGESTKELLKQVMPFVKWLQEAESSDE